MRRFFLALGVGVEDVARPLPGVAQVTQPPADRRLGEARPTPALQVLLQQRDGPFDRPVAEVIRPPLERGGEVGPEFVRPRAGVIAPTPVRQGGRVARLVVARDPVVDAHPAGAEHPGDLGDGSPGGRLRDGPGAAKEPGVGGVAQLPFESGPLGGGQLGAAHGAPR